MTNVIPFLKERRQRCHKKGTTLWDVEHIGPWYVDNTLSYVQCGACEEKLNPIWVIHYMARQETRWHDTYHKFKGMVAELDKRSRTKCKHCGRFTDIRIKGEN